MFAPLHNQRIYQQVAGQIQEMILDGRLKSGDKLLPERTMSEQFKVSRNSIREAIRALEILGIVESRQGGGNFIVAGTSDCLFEPLSIMFKLRNGSFSDLLEIRRGLEMEAASLAAQKITKAQAAEMKELLEKFKNASGEQESIDLDKKLHLFIAEISGNTMLSAFLNSISKLFEQAVRDGRELILKAFDNNKLLIKMHRDLCEAVTSGKPDDAAKACRRHFDFILDNLKK
ncbi:MAG: hypothetical protein A2020_14720 [Lentisphaerae bacterium GWF2_45_14]|nr:MAG: hypothetical protein A2020_14720 [Lentisphaerae bacterium GWF2_45_14]